MIILYRLIIFSPLPKLTIGTSKGFIRGKALSTEGHTHGADSITYGILPLARGGTGVGDTRSLLQSLHSVSGTSNYIATFGDSWNNGGYVSLAQLKSLLGVGAAGGPAKINWRQVSYIPFGDLRTGTTVAKPVPMSGVYDFWLEFDFAVEYGKTATFTVSYVDAGTWAQRSFTIQNGSGSSGDYNARLNLFYMQTGATYTDYIITSYVDQDAGKTIKNFTQTAASGGIHNDVTVKQTAGTSTASYCSCSVKVREITF